MFQKEKIPVGPIQMMTMISGLLTTIGNVQLRIRLISNSTKGPTIVQMAIKGLSADLKNGKEMMREAEIQENIL